METNPFTPTEQRLLLGLALLGFLGPNGVFLYYAMTSPALVSAAWANPITLVFMVEALVLMLLSAWLIHRSGSHGLRAGTFVLLSLVGSLAFSVPVYLYLAARRRPRAP